MRRILVYVIWSFLFVTAQVSAQSTPAFPRLAGLNINGLPASNPQSFASTTFQQQVARLSFAIFGAYPGWGGSSSVLQQAISNIKAINPGILIFNYNLIDSLPPGGGAGNAMYGPSYSQISAMNWFAYLNGTSGTIATQQGYEKINITNFVPPDSAGELFTDWHAKWAVANLITPWPGMDGLFTDNVLWEPPVDADWNRDGTTDSRSDPTVQQWYRLGFQRYFNDVNALLPGKMQLGNLAPWGDPNSNLTEYNQRLQGGLIEGLVGQTWSPETWGGWAFALAWYRKTMAAIAAPQLVIFHQVDVPTNYQSMRYGLATCLLDNGYYTFSQASSATSGGDYNTIIWFDEFNVSLGQATSSPPTAAWQKGVWRRDFQNGIALANPKGNGVQTVTLETSYNKIKGTQAPNVNNGRTVTTVTLQDRDGLILMRITPQAARPSTSAIPAAPTSVTATAQ